MDEILPSDERGSYIRIVRSQDAAKSIFFSGEYDTSKNALFPTNSVFKVAISASQIRIV